MGGDERRSGEKGLVHVRNYFLNVIVTSKQKSRPETQHKKKAETKTKIIDYHQTQVADRNTRETQSNQNTEDSTAAGSPYTARTALT